MIARLLEQVSDVVRQHVSDVFGDHVSDVFWERTEHVSDVFRRQVGARIAGLALGAAAAASGCDVSGVVGSRWLASATLSPAQGGSIAVSAAESPALAGSELLLPVGALEESTLIGVAPGSALAAGDWIAAGPAVAWDPRATALAAPGQFAIPAALPQGRSPNELLLLTDLPGSSVVSGQQLRFDGALLRFSSEQLGTFQAALGKPCSDRSGCAQGDVCAYGACRPGDPR